MKLAVSIGNGSIRAAFSGSAGKQMVFNTWDIAALGKIDAEITDSIIASVVPAYTDEVAAVLEEKTGKPPRRVDTAKCGRLNTSRYEGLLGEDRAVCCARALEKYGAPVVVIDFGVVTTVNVVNAEGEFLGGAVLAGLTMGLDALAKGAALLPRVGWIGEVHVVGKNTTEGMHAGAVIGLAGAAEAFVSRLGAESRTVIVTGTQAPVVLPWCRFEHVHEPDLLMEGLLGL